LHTGQHYDEGMSDRFFSELDLPKPEIELGVGSASHGQQTGRMLIGIEAAIAEHRPGAVLVYGDTNSTIAGALAAAKLHVPIAHVEAGLRSFNRRMPEEINRVVTDALSTLLFCPSQIAASHLSREGITSGVHVVGDVMAEALQRYGDAQRDADVLRAHQLDSGSYALATVHRAENTDDPERWSAIMRALSSLPFPVIFPAHPRLASRLAAGGPGGNVTVVAPVGYGEMASLTRNARVVLTDSGGLQKEAYWLGVPCVTLRDETEWVETVDAGWNQLTGADTPRIVTAAERASKPAARPPLYGEGGAVDRIVTLLSEVRGAA
jgi:UDP-GlcNAc3NAcA epimerase